jgi:hypothetical protein
MKRKAKDGSDRMAPRRVAEAAVLVVLAAAGVWWGFAVYAEATANRELSLENRAIVELERRLAPAGAALADVRVVGYLDGRLDDDPARRDRRYKMTRYVLAPTLVVNSADGGVVLADFETAESLDAYLATHPFKVWQRFGGGLAILEAGKP